MRPNLRVAKRRTKHDSDEDNEDEKTKNENERDISLGEDGEPPSSEH